MRDESCVELDKKNRRRTVISIAEVRIKETSVKRSLVTGKTRDEPRGLDESRAINCKVQFHQIDRAINRRRSRILNSAR